MSSISWSVKFLFLAIWLAGAYATYIYWDSAVVESFRPFLLAGLILPLSLKIQRIIDRNFELTIAIALTGAFKVATLGLIQTEIGQRPSTFPWHGFKRDDHGRLTASDSAAAIIGLVALLALATALLAWLAD